MADEIKWKDEDCEYHGHASGRIMRSEIGTGDFFRTSYDEGARAMLAELARRGEEIERLKFDLGRFKRMSKNQRQAIEYLHSHQLDGGRGFAKELLPGVTLSTADLVEIVAAHGRAIGQALKRDTTP